MFSADEKVEGRRLMLVMLRRAMSDVLYVCGDFNMKEGGGLLLLLLTAGLQMMRW